MPIITFETVSKEFTPESFGVQDISFIVEPGELIFITGHSGSGKTTLMKLLTKEYTPTTGEIFFYEEPLSTISKKSVHKHRRRIGVVFQDYQLVPEMNVWENIALPLYVAGKKEQEIEQRVTDLLNLIKLPEKADQFPSQLSGGEAQRVSIARALAIGPEVIFADEPTGNLDPETSLTIARLLRKINELGTTVLIATHDQEVLREHDDSRRIELDKGHIVKDTHSKKTAKSTKPAKETAEQKTEQKVLETVVESATEEPKEKKPSLLSKWFGKKTQDMDDEKEPEVTTENLDDDHDSIKEEKDTAPKGKEKEKEKK